MKHAVKCKLCKAPHVVETDDGYSELGDPFKLLPLFTCNPCYDRREKRVRLEKQMERWCRMLILQPKMKGEERQTIRQGLLSATRKYAEIVALIYGADVIWWEEEFTNLMMERPEKVGVILAKYCSDVARNTRKAA